MKQFVRSLPPVFRELLFSSSVVITISISENVADVCSWELSDFEVAVCVLMFQSCGEKFFIPRQVFSEEAAKRVFQKRLRLTERRICENSCSKDRMLCSSTVPFSSSSSSSRSFSLPHSSSCPPEASSSTLPPLTNQPYSIHPTVAAAAALVYFTMICQILFDGIAASDKTSDSVSPKSLAVAANLKNFFYSYVNNIIYDVRLFMLKLLENCEARINESTFVASSSTTSSSASVQISTEDTSSSASSASSSAISASVSYCPLRSTFHEQMPFLRKQSSTQIIVYVMKLITDVLLMHKTHEKQYDPQGRNIMWLTALAQMQMHFRKKITEIIRKSKAKSQTAIKEVEEEGIFCGEFEPTLACFGYNHNATAIHLLSREVGFVVNSSNLLLFLHGNEIKCETESKTVDPEAESFEAEMLYEMNYVIIDSIKMKRAIESRKNDPRSVLDVAIDYAAEMASEVFNESQALDGFDIIFNICSAIYPEKHIMSMNNESQKKSSISEVESKQLNDPPFFIDEVSAQRIIREECEENGISDLFLLLAHLPSGNTSLLESRAYFYFSSIGLVL
ncbi:uncharacterized protein MONOS_1702 [Monocercomonoides exilis]|uniref:uncharacterized protein n=1 Tax=Monocercomonoides exilis TaxID=2049356 RepID=UPI00355AC83A|nr:hypothetical protein MONOS_1702 [Monocercomonoides exilis]|eukprot:MONOS_1702.1-p1 / transcript=MONOS_1702.1 / gene=MONOS_1702 / organism=Monocercomonoides_exilis_PA203 / gene_product=unspecified product / transcript_product=unspecified product / location=Mono_scaffold00031:141726-143597(-) / protein_length=564 / sequence_SO=supercontig / SO=protein_coding / is_pseudo=false